ncbi:MAG: amidohydrolase, partial [Gemmatimonadaceae bacterium]
MPILTRPSAAFAFAFALAATACSSPATSDTSSAIDPTVTLAPPGGKTREISFTTDEGTGMSVAVAPDGRWIAFDLLGHIYRMPIAGGHATALTQNSGPALNFHPAISPDGQSIAFTSDRNGQLNIWVMDADGGHPRLVHGDSATRYLQPAWARDGKSIVAVRLFRSPGRSWHRQNRTLYRLRLDGSAPEVIVDEHLTQPDAPSLSADGKYLYYHV